jgi:segregation and condensation protein B
VNVGGVIKTLLEKRLITTAGRKEVIGRPILYRTSKQFLMRFGLFDLDELPSLKEFEALAQAALGDDAGIAPIEPEDSSVAPAASSESPTGTETAAGAVLDDPIEADVAAASPQISDDNVDSAENPSGEADNVRAAAASGGKGPSEPAS